jgi:protein-S-isoprenylcysteine O-methyltransferase Ste14
MAMHHDTRSLPELLSSLVTEMSTLFRQEIRLARTETSENVGKMTGAIAMLAASAVMLIPGIVIVLQGIVAMLVARGFDQTSAMFVVGLVAIVIGAIILSIGMARLRMSTLAPDRTINQVRRDALVAKEQVR